MTLRPILFSAPMIRAILDGRKTQTRRVLKPMAGLQSKWLTADMLNSVPAVRMAETSTKGGPRDVGVQLTHPRGGPLGWIRSPFGGAGDLLWVRETWRVHQSYDTLRPRLVVEAMGGDYRGCIDYCATPRNEPFWGKTRVSIFMPPEFSRITLEITDVRVERLNEISEADAMAEGIERVEDYAWNNYRFTTAHPRKPSPATSEDNIIRAYGDPRASYKSLWESINGARSWGANPYVWVITFKRITP